MYQMFILLVMDIFCFSTEDLKRSDTQRLFETLHKRGCVGWRWETGTKPLIRHKLHIYLWRWLESSCISLIFLSFSQTCNKCKTRRKCTKRFSIQKFPQILVLRILSSHLHFVSSLRHADAFQWLQSSCKHVSIHWVSDTAKKCEGF